MSETVHPSGVVGGSGATGSSDRWEDLAHTASLGASVDAELDRVVEFLTCELAGSPYALPVDRIREIVRMRSLTPLPRTPKWLLGVISLRGEVVQVVDLRMCLGLPESDIGRATRIIVLHGEDDQTMGVLVDGVREVLRIEAGALCASASGGTGAVSQMCRNGEQFVSIVDLDRVLENHGSD